MWRYSHADMFSDLPIAALISLFLVASVGVWVAGVYLSKATDILCERCGMGEALGGMIFLSVVTNLPEVAITTSGALRHDLAIAVGNLLGGIAMQTVVLVVLDVFGMSKKAPLSQRAASPQIVLEGVLVIAILAVAVMGSQLPASLIFARITPDGALITALWIMGLWVIGKMRKASWPDDDPPSEEIESDCAVPVDAFAQAQQHTASTLHTVIVFVLGSVLTLVCGVMLETSSEAMARRIGMSGAVFGATILAAVTALPQLSTGLAAVKLGDYQMAVSDVLGGNAFLPVLFLLASLLSGQAVLPLAQKTDIYLSGLGILLTAVYMTGLIYQPSRKIARMGIDSFAVLVFYLLGIAGLAAIARS
jgi:cation:H+ antiporter